MKEVKKYIYAQGARIEDRGTRIYDVAGHRLPSVTTILGATKNQQFLAKDRQDLLQTHGIMALAC